MKPDVKEFRLELTRHESPKLYEARLTTIDGTLSIVATGLALTRLDALGALVDTIRSMATDGDADFWLREHGGAE